MNRPLCIYAIEISDAVLIGLSNDPLRSHRFLNAIDPGGSRLVGFIPASVEIFEELHALCEPHRRPDGLFDVKGKAVEGFLAALPPYEVGLRVVGGGG